MNSSGTSFMILQASCSGDNPSRRKRRDRLRWRPGGCWQWRRGVYSDRDRRAPGRFQRICIDDPVDAAHVATMASVLAGLARSTRSPKKFRAPGVVGFLQTFEE